MAGQELENFFPDQDATDFAVGCTENTWGPLNGKSQRITGLLMVRQGERDESDWVWLVKLEDGTHWWVEGGCDYTGWDCSSHLYWEQWEAAA